MQQVVEIIDNDYNFPYSKYTECIKKIQHGLDLRNANSKPNNHLSQYWINADKCSEWSKIIDNDYNFLYNKYTGCIKKIQHDLDLRNENSKPNNHLSQY